MKIVKAFPPNIDAIRRRFDLSGKNPVFTFGDTIYNPRGTELPEHLIVHESVHIKQQEGNPFSWWLMYLDDDKFRLEQELEAYRAQYKFITEQPGNRGSRRRVLHLLAGDLSSAMYGNIISFQEAMEQIKNDH